MDAKKEVLRVSEGDADGSSHFLPQQAMLTSIAFVFFCNTNMINTRNAFLRYVAFTKVVSQFLGEGLV